MQINPKEIIIQGVLIPCEHTKVQQVGIDLTLSEDVDILHGHAKNVLLNEIVKLPDNIYSTFIHRSSFNRNGIFVTGSIYDPGYNGQVGCTIYNFSGKSIYLDKNERVGQMVFYSADAASKYNGQYQNENLPISA